MAKKPVNRSIQRRVINGFKNEQKESNDRFEQVIKELEAAKTVEDMIVIKQTFLVKYIRKMPIYDDTCYFCVETASGYECQGCAYGKIHGICGSGYKSDKKKEKLPTWDRIARARNRLVELLWEYYVGESYGGP